MDLLNNNSNLIYTNHFNKIVYTSTFVYNYKDLFESIILENNIITIKHNNYDNNLEMNKLLYSCGINFTNNIYIDDGLFNFSFKAKALNQKTFGKKFKIYNGSSWITIDKSLSYNFDEFNIKSNFYFNSPSKWRICLFNNEYGDEYQIKDLFLEEKNNIHNYELNKIEDSIKIIFVIDNSNGQNMDFYKKVIDNSFKSNLKYLNRNVLFFTHNTEQKEHFEMNVNKEDFLFFIDFINAKDQWKNNNFIDKKLLKMDKETFINKICYDDYTEIPNSYKNIDCNKIIIQNYESLAHKPEYFYLINKKINPTFIFTNHYYFNNNNKCYYLGHMPVYNGPPIKYNPKKYFMCIQPISSSFNKNRFTILEKLILDLDKYISNNKLDDVTRLDIHFYGGGALSIFVDKLCNKIKNFNIILKDTNETINKKIQSQQARSIEKLEIYKDYKFNIVLENLFHDFYYTEKFYDILYGNSISIYFGSPNINLIFSDFFSNEGVINGFDYYNDSHFNNTFLKKILSLTDEEINEKINKQHLLLKQLNNIDKDNFWEYIFDIITKNEKINIDNYFYLLNKDIFNLNEKIIKKPFLDKLGNIIDTI
jgi:hypothetical protein